VTAAAVLAVALDLRRALEKLSPREREEAILLLLDDEPVEPEDVTRAQLEELAPDVAAAFPTELPAEKPAGIATRPGARPDMIAQGEARLLELVQRVANAGGRAQTRWLAEQMGISYQSAKKYADRAIAARYLVYATAGVVELNPAPDAPVVVANRSGEGKGRRRG
jgi:hypothetical protein